MQKLLSLCFQVRILNVSYGIIERNVRRGGNGELTSEKSAPADESDYELDVGMST